MKKIRAEDMKDLPFGTNVMFLYYRKEGIK